MAYFNHAFSKMFLGTGEDLTTPGDPVTSLKGFVTTPDIPTVTISELGPGYFGFVNPNTWTTVAPGAAPANCCPLVLVSSSVLSRDKIGKFHGGYLETNKSKVINPRYIQRFYRVDPCVPRQAVISIGNTPGVTDGYDYDTACLAQEDGFLDPNNFQSGTTCGQCCKEFLCGETYYLRIDVKGSPALRALNHQAYYTVDAYTGCCPDQPDDPLIPPTAVDSTIVMIKWAEQIVRTQYLNEFIAPVVYDQNGKAWYAPGTTVTYDGTNNPVAEADWWTNYPYPGYIDGACAGLRLFGAYVDTRFLNCSFQVTDYFEKEPLRIFASEVDYTGDPCLFTGLCVYNDCNGIQGMGFGEQVVRDLIRSESYLQNFFHTDIRIREITQGNQFLDVVDRQAFYTRYYLLHSVPRFNNPTGTFDNDRYLLEIIIPEANPAAPTGNTTLENFMEDWLGNCPQCVTLEANTCGACNIVPDPVVL
jgi:hypothetical protein